MTKKELIESIGACLGDVECTGCVYNDDGEDVLVCRDNLRKEALKALEADEGSAHPDARTFDTGARRDDNTGKGRMDLLPWNAIIAVSQLCQYGAEHYGERNVDRGIPVSVLLDSELRHAPKILMGFTDEDYKLTLYHYRANAWNALWALEMALTRPDMVDVPWNKEEGAANE